MRRITTMAAAMVRMVTLSAGAAFALTLRGNPWAEEISGTSKGDTIHGLGGDDVLIVKQSEGDLETLEAPLCGPQRDAT